MNTTYLIWTFDINIIATEKNNGFFLFIHNGLFTDRKF